MAEQDSKQFDTSTDPGEETVHHQSNRQGREVEAASMQLNLTSMIDVIFLLLIYFVVTASFAANEAVLVTNLSGGGNSDPMAPPPMELNIRLTSAGSTGANIKVAGREVPSFSTLADRLIELQHNPEQARSGNYAVDDPVKIRPQGGVRWQHVVNAFNAAVKAEYENVALTAPE
jgi:biopolymer transport protein ExbD